MFIICNLPDDGGMAELLTSQVVMNPISGILCYNILVFSRQSIAHEANSP